MGIKGVRTMERVDAQHRPIPNPEGIAKYIAGRPHWDGPASVENGSGHRS